VSLAPELTADPSTSGMFVDTRSTSPSVIALRSLLLIGMFSLK
jgi:hypothetical protein